MPIRLYLLIAALLAALGGVSYWAYQLQQGGYHKCQVEAQAGADKLAQERITHLNNRLMEAVQAATEQRLRADELERQLVERGQETEVITREILRMPGAGDPVGSEFFELFNRAIGSAGQSD